MNIFFDWLLTIILQHISYTWNQSYFQLWWNLNRLDYCKGILTDMISELERKVILTRWHWILYIHLCYILWTLLHGKLTWWNIYFMMQSSKTWSTSERKRKRKQVWESYSNIFVWLHCKFKIIISFSDKSMIY